MKLATLDDGSRDGQLVVVSRDLSLAHHASGIASRMQQLLDDWNFLSPQLEDLYATLNGGKARHAFAFEPRQCRAPLPRAYQRVEAVVHPIDAVPAVADSEPRMRRCASDVTLGACDDAVFADGATGIDFAAGVAAVTGDLPMGADASQALDSVRLLVLVNAWALRESAPEPAGASGVPLAEPAAAFGPCAVTPDELVDAWRGGRVRRPLVCVVNGREVGRPDAGAGVTFPFGTLISHLARARAVGAGSIVGAGTARGGDLAAGSGCLADRRAIETVDGGAARTPWLADGDRVRIEMAGADGQSLFGAIEQCVRIGPR